MKVNLNLTLKQKQLLGIIAAVVILLIIVIIALVSGHQNNPQNIETPTVNIIVPETSEASSEPIEETTEPVIYNERYNVLTGQMSDVDFSTRRPLVVILDNLYSARPQAALSEADIIYEILAEGLITRYMAVFYGTLPDHVGPIRSARPYFVEKALEYDPYIVHVGGSMQALSDIKKYKMADIDGLSSGAFWRENHKKAPHNMYSSSEVLLKDALRLKYNTHSEVSFLKFNTSYQTLTGDIADEIHFVYKEPTASDKIGYATSYKYNEEDFLYYRYTNGNPHVDENDKNQLTCTNILVQYAKTQVIDNEGRLNIELVGKGEGRYYTSGHYIDVTWEKKTPDSMTEFFDLNGIPLTLNPGVTWIQVMKTGNVEKIK